MTLQEIIDQVRSNLNEEDVTGFYSDEEITNWANQGLTTFATVAKPPSMQEVQYIETNGEGKYSLPENFLEVFMVKINDEPIDSVALENSDEDGYFIWGTDITVTNDTEGNKLDLYYIKQPNRLDSKTSVPNIDSIYHKALVNFATYKALQKDEKYNVAETYKADFSNDIKVGIQNTYKPKRNSWKVVR